MPAICRGPACSARRWGHRGRRSSPSRPGRPGDRQDGGAGAKSSMQSVRPRSRSAATVSTASSSSSISAVSVISIIMRARAPAHGRAGQQACAEGGLCRDRPERLAAIRAPSRRGRRGGSGGDHRPVQLLRHGQHLGQRDEMPAARAPRPSPDRAAAAPHSAPGAVAHGDDRLEGHAEAASRDGPAQPGGAGTGAGQRIPEPARGEARLSTAPGPPREKPSNAWRSARDLCTGVSPSACSGKARVSTVASCPAPRTRRLLHRALPDRRQPQRDRPVAAGPEFAGDASAAGRRPAPRPPARPRAGLRRAPSVPVLRSGQTSAPRPRRARRVARRAPPEARRRAAGCPGRAARVRQKRPPAPRPHLKPGDGDRRAPGRQAGRRSAAAGRGRAGWRRRHRRCGGPAAVPRSPPAGRSRPPAARPCGSATRRRRTRSAPPPTLPAACRRRQRKGEETLTVRGRRGARAAEAGPYAIAAIRHIGPPHPSPLVSAEAGGGVGEGPVKCRRRARITASSLTKPLTFHRGARSQGPRR